MEAVEPAPPSSWRDALTGYRWNRLTKGASGAEVFQLDAPSASCGKVAPVFRVERCAILGDELRMDPKSGNHFWVRCSRPDLFVKREPEEPFAEGPGEAERLRWLSGRGIAAPRVLAAEHHAGHHWLLMSAVPGRDAASTGIGPSIIVTSVANALLILHAEPIAGCPFDHTLERRVARARARVAAGAVDTSGIDGIFAGRSAPDLLAELEATRPLSEDLAVTHGDACLENILLDDSGALVGFVDCGRLGVADRYQDLALASRSIGEILGEEWVAPFLARYGVTAPDNARLRFYQLLDEFS